MCHYIDNIRTIKCVFYFLEPLRWDIAWLGFLFEVDALLFAPDDVIMGGVTLKIVIVEYVD